jgi:molybdopterin-guanine dinucleotide biosynthesis protein A
MEQVFGVILAGGRSSRMGGHDKALAVVNGETLLARTLRQLGNQTQKLVLNTNAASEQFSDYGLPILPDRLSGLPGPLAGIHAALVEYPQALVLTAAVDIPYFPADLVARLRAGLGDHACAYAFNGDHHALAILWAPESDGLVEAYLASGERSLKGFLAEHGHAVLFDRQEDTGLFDNLNTPEDLMRLETASV